MPKRCMPGVICIENVTITLTLIIIGCGILFLNLYNKKDNWLREKIIIKENNYATEAEVEAIDQRVNDLVAECEKFAEESPFPEAQQLYDVVYEQENYPFIPHRL